MTFCPEHPDEELRREYGNRGPTGFCSKCLKHYSLCTATRYMSSCNKLKGHTGPHQTNKSHEWESEFNK